MKYAVQITRRDNRKDLTPFERDRYLSTFNDVSSFEQRVALSENMASTNVSRVFELQRQSQYSFRQVPERHGE